MVTSARPADHPGQELGRPGIAGPDEMVVAPATTAAPMASTTTASGGLRPCGAGGDHQIIPALTMVGRSAAKSLSTKSSKAFAGEHRGVQPLLSSASVQDLVLVALTMEVGQRLARWAVDVRRAAM